MSVDLSVKVPDCGCLRALVRERDGHAVDCPRMAAIWLKWTGRPRPKL